MSQVRDTRAIQQAIRGNMEVSIKIMVEDLAARASRDAPVDEGTLRASAHPEVDREGNTVTGTVTFATPYARVQHEDLTFNHPKGGRAKYLEANLTAMTPRYRDVLAKAFQQGMGHG